MRKKSLPFWDKFTISLIHLYQSLDLFLGSLIISVFGVKIGCKQIPTCSQYTINQIEKHGTIRGLLLGMYRIASCW